MEIIKGRCGEGFNLFRVINDLSDKEVTAVKLFNYTDRVSRSDVIKELKLHRSTAWNVLSKLRKRGLIRKYGVANSTYYRLTTPGNFIRVSFKYSE